jgi:RNA polymerase sigma-70 factor (ECF subfamily)
MFGEDAPSTSAQHSSAQFATTHWSVVVAAAELASPEAGAALETLCRTYWYPLYAFARRRGHSPADAKDLTQGFLAQLVQKRLASRADPELGRFRTFLLRAFTDFLTDQHRREHAAKRGGDCTFVSLDVAAVEQHLAANMLAAPERLFDQKWALTVVRQTTALLQTEYAEGDRPQLFASLSPYLQGERGLRTYAELATPLGMSESAIRVAVFRLRRRYRELLRAVVARTVNDPRDIDDEIRYLVQVLAA